MKLLRHAFAALLFAISAVSQAQTFVGSWTVDQGPSWTTSPQAYSGQQAAALLFGGNAADYVISSVSSAVIDIDHMAWVSTWGGACSSAFPCGTTVAENFVQSSGGFYVNVGDTSAYVTDWAVGQQYTNYAFRVAAVPEAETYAMLMAGLAVLGVVARRRKQV